MAVEKKLALWARSIFNEQAGTLEKLAGDGSQRLFYRFRRASGQSFILLHGSDEKENLAYFNLGLHLWFKGLPLPRIHRFQREDGFFLLEDLDDLKLADPPPSEDFYVQAARALAAFHKKGLADFNPAWSHQSRKYDARLVYEKEFGYFLEEMGRHMSWPAPAPALQREGRELARAICRDFRPVLMHRDFQNRNLMIKEGAVFIIDWQGARLGPAAYDLASLLADPYVDLPWKIKEAVIKNYARAASCGEKKLRREMARFSAARLMQALGAYAKLTRLGKKSFQDHMSPAALRLWETLQHKYFAPYPLLREKARLLKDALLEKAAKN